MVNTISFTDNTEVYVFLEILTREKNIAFIRIIVIQRRNYICVFLIGFYLLNFF